MKPLFTQCSHGLKVGDEVRMIPITRNRWQRPLFAVLKFFGWKGKRYYVASVSHDRVGYTSR